MPYRNVPSVHFGRLALDKSLQGQGFGSMLVTHAMRVVYNASLAVGIHGLFVEALNDKAKAFYKSLGFIQLVGNNERSLFYPTKTIEKIVRRIMCPPHLRGNFDITNHKPLSPSYCEKDLAFGFFGHYIIIADINRFSPIAEQHAGCLWFNDAPTYHTTHDERQKHLSDVFYCSSHSPLPLCFEDACLSSRRSFSSILRLAIYPP